jgi:2-polyprenyl-3-methyl-5-hydroxy-6-metoxy-1,4-benzoquinol methylase
MKPRSVSVYEDMYLKILKGEADFMYSPPENLIRMIRMEKILASPGRVDSALEFGCGEGRNCEYLFDLGYQVFATDVSEWAIEASRKRMKDKAANLHLSRPGAPLPHEDRLFSLIIAWEVLHWLGNKDLFITYLDEFMRTLKPGGTLILTMPTEACYWLFTAVQIGESLYQVATEDRKDALMYAPNQFTLQKCLHDKGFEHRRITRYDFFDEHQEGGLIRPHSMYVLAVRKPAA